jgi:hypothetical protein
MSSIIAESHYDSGRNFIAMVRGKKRYILSHPRECRYVFTVSVSFCQSVSLTMPSFVRYCCCWCCHQFSWSSDSKLSMLTKGAMKRHASFDWSDPSNFQLFEDAQAFEVRLLKLLLLLWVVGCGLWVVGCGLWDQRVDLDWLTFCA